MSTISVYKGVLNEPLLSPQTDINSGWRRWNLDTKVKVKVTHGRTRG